MNLTIKVKTIYGMEEDVQLKLQNQFSDRLVKQSSWFYFMKDISFEDLHKIVTILEVDYLLTIHHMIRAFELVLRDLEEICEDSTEDLSEKIAELCKVKIRNVERAEAIQKIISSWFLDVMLYD